MQLLSVPTRLIGPGDDVASLLAGSVQEGDIIAISSKAIATAEGAVMDLKRIIPSSKAEDWSKKTGRSPAFMEAVLLETKRLNGNVVGFCPGALLTEVHPKGLAKGSILTANAGLDESNIQKNHAIGWPQDPVDSLKHLWEAINLEWKKKQRKQKNQTHQRIALLMTDSCCRPRRLGVTAFALAVLGFEPVVSQQSKKDLCGKKLTITCEAVADQLATAANMLMGNAGQSIPAVIIRDHGIPFTAFCGWVPGIEPEKDLFQGVVCTPSS